MAFEVTVDSTTATFFQCQEDWVWLKTENSQTVCLPLSSILVGDRPAQASDFGEATVVVIAPKDNPTAGYIKTLKATVEKSDSLLEWRFRGMKSIGNSDFFTMMFYGLLETSVLMKNKKLLSIAKANVQQLSTFGVSTDFTINFLEYLERAHKPASLEYLASFMEDQEYIRVFQKEIGGLSTAYYQGKEEIYRKAIERNIEQNVWVNHALASVFDLILIEVKMDPNSLQYTHYFPNSLSPWTAPLYFQSAPPRLLYRKEAFHLQTVPGKLSELLLHRNWFSFIRERQELHRCIPDSSSNETLFSLYQYITAEYQEPLPDFDLSSDVLGEAQFFSPPASMQVSHVSDPISLCLREEVEKMKPLTELLVGLFCCFCRQIRAEHRFPCRCGACGNCIYGKLVETENIHCPVHNQIVPAEDLQPQLPPQLLTNACRNFKKLRCGLCKLKTNRRDFPVKRKAKPLVYVLDCGDPVCVNCLETAARRKTGECPICSTFVDLHEAELASQVALCVHCQNRKAVGSDFSSVKCSDHRSCTACLSQVRDTSKCPTCQRDFNYEEVDVLQRMLNLKCKECKKKCKSADLWPSAGPCNCILCIECGNRMTQRTLNIVACPVCLKGKYDYRQVLASYHAVLYSGFEELADVPEAMKALEDRKAHTKCLICYQPIPDLLSRATAARTCPHLFHKECLGQALEEQINQIRQNQLKRRLRCPLQNCPLEVDTEFLTGQFAIIPEESYNQYQEYVIKLEALEFTCKQCKIQGFIPLDQRNFQCQCGYNQCVKCHGAWSDQHNDKVCQFYIIQALAQGLTGHCDRCQDKGCDVCIFAQCPGCKYPYLKDDHCDHVRCERLECRVEFCFRCACLRKPTTEHSNQWHRKQCKWYPNDNSEEVNKKVVKDEPVRKGCPECTRLGRRCDPPPDLQHPRVFSLEEYLV